MGRQDRDNGGTRGDGGTLTKGAEPTGEARAHTHGNANTDGKPIDGAPTGKGIGAMHFAGMLHLQTRGRCGHTEVVCVHGAIPMPRGQATGGGAPTQGLPCCQRRPTRELHKW